MIRFNRDALREGMIVHVWGVSWISRVIEAYLNDGSHDAILILRDGRWGVGDSVWPRNKWTPLEEYEREMNAAKPIKCAVYWPTGATPDQGQRAATWWVINVEGTRYDPTIYVKIIVKVLGLKWIVPNWTWANWCTEGVARAWKCGGNLDVWHNDNPTPLTTERRRVEGALADVVDAITAD